MANLDGILDRLDNAERKAIYDLRNAGFLVNTVEEARLIRTEYRQTARLQARAVERMSTIAQGRRTA
jgi:hypothetical protein